MNNETRPAISKWRQTKPELILCAVRWYLRYSLSLRDVEELFAERGLEAKVTLTNKGALAAQISEVAVTAPFTIAGSGDTCSGQSIAPKGTCSFEVEFAPTTVAKVSGSIDVTYNGTSPAVSLVGNGIAK